MQGYAGSKHQAVRTGPTGGPDILRTSGRDIRRCHTAAAGNRSISPAQAKTTPAIVPTKAQAGTLLLSKEA